MDEQNKYGITDERMIIMLVDDQTIIAEAVRRLLNTRPYFDFHYCAEGSKAHEKALKLKPLVILQDLIMPDADGIDLLRTYRKSPELSDTRIAVLSVKEDPVVKKSAFEAGAHDYMVKLPDHNEFLARVHHHAKACLDGRRLKDAMLALKESQQQTIDRNIELEMLNEQKNRILGVAAHDLRNPLGNIQAFSSFLADEAFKVLSPKHREMVTYIKNLSDFTLRMVEDLLDVSTIESGELRLDFEKLNIGELIKHNVHLNSILAEKKQITLKYLPSSGLPHVRGDPGKISQVLNNIIGNAIKYSYPETSIRIAVVPGDNELRISVTDQGQGIPASDIPNLFKPFGRAQVKTTGGEESTGLGLAIARKIVEGHGGRIGVSSREGSGSTFYFTIPLDSGSHTEIEAHDPSENTISAISSISAVKPDFLETKRWSSSNTRILIAEDNSFNSIVARKVLNVLGLDSDIAENGRQALEMIENKSYDIVLMDMEMPEMNGIEVTRAVMKKDDPDFKRPVIIAMTAHTNEEKLELFTEAGMNDYINKPLSVKKVETVLAKWIRE